MYLLETCALPAPSSPKAANPEDAVRKILNLHLSAEGKSSCCGAFLYGRAKDVETKLTDNLLLVGCVCKLWAYLCGTFVVAKRTIALTRVCVVDVAARIVGAKVAYQSACGVLNFTI